MNVIQLDHHVYVPKQTTRQNRW